MNTRLFRETRPTGHLGQQRKSVLLVHSDETEGDSVEQWLREHDCIVSRIADPSLVERFLQTAMYDAVLLDLDGAGDRSNAIALAVRNGYPSTLLIGIPAVHDDLCFEALASGVEYVIPRPLTQQSIADSLQRAAEWSDRSAHRGALSLTVSRFQERSEYCPRCKTLVADADSAVCFECGASAPESGWTNVTGSEYPQLGLTVEDRYVTDQFLGGGSTSQVYRARDRVLHRHVALKFVRFGAEETPAKKKLLANLMQREAMATSRLSSPHVVHIWDVVTIDSTTVVMVMDYVKGSTVEEVVRKRGALPVRDAMTIARQLGFALVEAHLNGLVHRDIKPANVLLEEMPNQGIFARLLDFGLVRINDQVGASRENLFFGTPGFSAPEQIQALPEVDGRADIYALGSLIYHMVTGGWAWGGGSARKICMRQLTDPAPRLPRHVAANGDVVTGLDQLIRRCLARTPDHRYPDALALLRDLESIGRLAQRDMPIIGGRAPTPSRLDLIAIQEPPPDTDLGGAPTLIAGPHLRNEALDVDS